ncbi:hypothetical protein BdWA1_002972 [Babesia duncani]|uniref:Uncharacterized protein n=1 Tax=Babesia duncani TaxID=323732 RepID=A0AAD9PI52_9APIC|nr:hypothetical protein BdWA1_002972 [Babesia duncani]
MVRGNTTFTNLDERRYSNNFSKSPIENDNKYASSCAPLHVDSGFERTGLRYKNGDMYSDSYMSNSLYDDVSTFCSNCKSSTLGISDFSKYESRSFRSRYLLEGQAPTVIYNCCQELSLGYYGKIETYCTIGLHRSDSATAVSQLQSTGICSNDFIRHLAIIAIGARYHPVLYLSENEEHSTNQDCVTMLLNVIRAIVFCVTKHMTADGRIGKNDSIKYFYNFIKSGYGYDSFDYGVPHQMAKRLVLIYALSVDLLNSILSHQREQAKLLLPAHDDIFELLSGVSCCYIEDSVNGNIHTPEHMKTTFVPAIATPFELCLQHWSLLYHLIDSGVNIGMSEMIIKYIKHLCYKMEDNTPKFRPLITWSYIVYLKLCPDQMSKNRHAIPKALFEEVSSCETVVQLRAVCETLGHCLRTGSFYEYVQQHINVERVIQIFMMKTCHRIQREQDDLAVLMLCLFNLIIDLYPSTLSHLAKRITIPNVDERDKFNSTIKVAIHTLFSVAVHGKGSFQPIICLILTKFLAVSDVSKTLNERDRDQIFKTLLSVLGVFSSDVSRTSSGCELAGKCAVLDALVKTAGLTTMSRLLNNVSMSELKRMALKGGIGPSVNSALFTGNFASRLLAYDSLKNKQDNFSGALFMTCVLTLAFKNCKELEKIFSSYCTFYEKIQDMSGSHLASFTKLIPLLNPGNDAIVWEDQTKTAILLTHFMVSSIYNSSDPERQGVLASMLSRCSTADIESSKYKNALTRLEASKRQLTSQIQKLSVRNMELENNMERLHAEYGSKLTRLEQDMTSYKSTVATARHQAEDLQLKLDKTRHAHEILQQENSRLKTEYKHMSDKLATSVDKCAQMENENARLKSQIRELQSNVSKLNKTNMENQRLSRELQEVSESMEQLCRMLIQLAYKHKSQKSTLSKVVKDLQDASNRVGHLRAELENVKSQYEAKTREVSDLAFANSKLESELSKARDDFHSCSSALESYKSKVQELNGRVADLSNRNRKIEQENSNMRDRFSAIQHELKDSKRKIQAIASTINSKLY